MYSRVKTNATVDRFTLVGFKMFTTIGVNHHVILE